MNYSQYLNRLDKIQLKHNASISRPTMVMNMIMKNRNKLEKQCPCIGLPNSPTYNFTAAELELEKQLEQAEILAQKQKNKNKNGGGNNSQITKNMLCSHNARNTKGGTVNYQQYLGWLDKAQLKKNASL